MPAPAKPAYRCVQGKLTPWLVWLWNARQEHAISDALTCWLLAESLVRELARMTVMETEDQPGARTPGVAAEEDEIPGLGEGGPSGELKLPFGDWLIDYGSPFVRVKYAELFERAMGFAMFDETKVREAARKHHEARHKKSHSESQPPHSEGGATQTPPQPWRTNDLSLVINELFEEFAEKLIDPAKPTFVLDYPSAISPLTRPKESDPTIAERWDLFIGGMEIGPAYTELNDPDIQEAKFREQLAGVDDEESTFRTFDQDFIDALKVGMPPAGGLGLGIDRLAMLLTGQRTIRDVLLFPMMRPV